MTDTLSHSPQIARFCVRNSNEIAHRLRGSDSDVIVLPQESAFNIGPKVQGLTNYEKRLEVDVTQSRELVSGVLSEMGIESEPILNNMIQSATLFAALVEQRRMEMRFEITDRQSCPKFHCDNVFIRMLVTYCGPTTEFIDCRELDIIYRAPVSALVFLKGHKHPTYQHRILHRSPAFIKGEKRLTMILNLCNWMGKR